MLTLLVLRETVPSQQQDVDVHNIAQNLLSEEGGGRAPSFAARGGFFVRLGVTIQPVSLLAATRQGSVTAIPTRCLEKLGKQPGTVKSDIHLV